MKIEKDEDKSLSANKLRYKSDKKNINAIQFDKIKIINHVSGHPLTCKHKLIQKLKNLNIKKLD